MPDYLTPKQDDSTKSPNCKSALPKPRMTWIRLWQTQTNIYLFASQREVLWRTQEMGTILSSITSIRAEGLIGPLAFVQR